MRSWNASEASRYPWDVPFVREFRWKTYGLGAVSLQEKSGFGDWCHLFALVIHGSTSLEGGSGTPSERPTRLVILLIYINDRER